MNELFEESPYTRATPAPDAESGAADNDWLDPDAAPSMPADERSLQGLREEADAPEVGL